jgi:hypothetical protein
MDTKAIDLKWITAQIAAAQDSGFFGQISIDFHAGTVRRVQRVESIVPPRPGVRVDR